MSPGEWIAALGAAGGFVAWMTAMWVRAGRILQRIDDFAVDQGELKRRAADHETRLTRAETWLEGLVR
jgi:membrane associated rhomboid family serine protease